MTNQFKFDKAAIEWRRNIVLKKLSMGWTQVEIAKELQLHPSSISLDCQYLRIKAQEEMNNYLQETLPFQHKQMMAGLTQVLYDLWDIAKNSTKMSERLQAYAQINDCYKHIREANTDSPTINRAMEFVLGINQKKLERENQELEQEPEQEKGPAPVEHAEPIPEQDIEQ